MEGTITIDDRVISHIAARAVEEVEGVHSMGAPSFTRSMAQALGSARPGAYGIGVQSGNMETAFNLAIVVEYGRRIPDVAQQVKTLVSERVQQYCGLNVKRVNVHVADVKQMPSRSMAQVQ